MQNTNGPWTKVILSTKLNKMKEKNDLVQRENDILKKQIDVWKIKENELKTKYAQHQFHLLPPTPVASPSHDASEDVIYDSLPPMEQSTVSESSLEDPMEQSRVPE
ncbi:hypothetical protein TNCV_3651131 [Trichonephila clavipes]|nr:hypothetical protein TNCV_3651131 [Trichonephila clavipes]